MNNKLIIVIGILAGGKTTFSIELSQQINIPCFNKDLIKIELNKNIEINNRDDSKKLSAATINIMMHIGPLSTVLMDRNNFPDGYSLCFKILQS